jgi:hypothetical protein
MHDPDDSTKPETATTVIVTLSDEACAELDTKKKELEEAGLEIEQVLDFIGQIVGTWRPDDLEPLRQIKGVADVEESRKVQLPPPDSSIQ